jgi:hypothetical protein
MSGAWPSFRMRSLSQRSQVILNFARENRLLLAMRGGGHNGPGTFVPLVSFSSTRAAHERGRAVNRGIGQGSSSRLAIPKEGMLGSLRMAGGDDAKWHRFGAFVLEPGNEVLRKGERITNAHERDARDAAELRRHLPDNLMRLDSSTMAFVASWLIRRRRSARSDSLSLVWLQVFITI